MRLIRYTLLAALVAPLWPAPGNFVVFIGTYTQKESKGIYAWRFDAATGKPSPLGVAAETVNPSFLAIHPTRKLVYAVSEISSFEGQKTGAVSAFAADFGTGKLKFLNK